jgi:hypothetical protein
MTLTVISQPALTPLKQAVKRWKKAFRRCDRPATSSHQAQQELAQAQQKLMALAQGSFQAAFDDLIQQGYTQLATAADPIVEQLTTDPDSTIAAESAAVRGFAIPPQVMSELVQQVVAEIEQTGLEPFLVKAIKTNAELSTQVAGLHSQILQQLAVARDKPRKAKKADKRLLRLSFYYLSVSFSLIGANLVLPDLKTQSYMLGAAALINAGGYLVGSPFQDQPSD